MSDAKLTLPPAWGPHKRTWMAWPCRAELWGTQINSARTAYATVAQAISRFEPVVLAARPQDADEAARMCGPAVEIWPVALDDSWARDIAPHFLSDGKTAVDWDFNAWGDEYEGYTDDCAFGARVIAREGLQAIEAHMVLEGGSICGDGAGTLMTTEECLLNPNRNPSLSRGEIEAKLMTCLGMSQVLWLGRGLLEDETDGHVDNIACFAPGRRVLLAMPNEKDDPNYPIMQENLARLKAARTASGAPYEIIEVPLPALRLRADGRRMTRSYINFHVVNGGLIVPAFDDPHDQAAARIIADAFPGRVVAQVEANPILAGGGGIHCITYEEPLVATG